MQKPTVLISGVSGFIAKHCAVEMLKSGYGVRGTLRSLNRVDDVRASMPMSRGSSLCRPTSTRTPAGTPQ
jgi:nucleoside-diphosphate-sugar epimerase